MKIYKFGGSSVKSADAVRNLKDILKSENDNLVIVISAMDKTTNNLEKLLNLWREGENFDEQLSKIMDFHTKIATDLLPESLIMPRLSTLFKELIDKISNSNPENYHESYDRIVSYGEIFSTFIISTYLNYEGLKNKWLDAREILITDNNFRQANVDFELTAQKIRQEINETEKKYIIQGFIGGTIDGKPTTLGREGSDYSAAIFANLLDAESLTLWKDVDGIYNADPKIFSDAQKIQKISYAEATELAFFGMKIIHPRTAKPLINKGIPLFIKSFEKFHTHGSIIDNFEFKISPNVPVFIVNDNQALLTLRSKNFEFISEKIFEKIFHIFNKHKIKINLIQNSALTVSLCFDYFEITFGKLLSDLQQYFYTRHNKNLTLLIIRHYSDEILKKKLSGKKIILEQKNRLNAFFLYENK